MITWFIYHYTSTNMTSKRMRQFVWLSKSLLKNMMGGSSGKRMWNHAECLFILWGRHSVAFCSAWFLGIFGQSMLTWPKQLRCSLLPLQWRWMAIVSMFSPSLKHQGQNDFGSMPAEMLGHLRALPKWRPCRPTMAWVMSFSYNQ